MADFLIAVALTLQHEGGYVNNPADPGGETNMGITQADMPGQDMRALTVAQAVEYYREHYWKPLYSQITSQEVASKIFDLGVLFGVGTAVKILQQILNLTVDGSFGPVTLAAVNNVYGGTVVSAYKAAMLRHVDEILARKSTEIIFRAGWQNRINS
jgi:lysozyme family protein